MKKLAFFISILISLIISSSVSAMNMKEFTKIINGKETEKIIKELQHYPIYKKFKGWTNTQSKAGSSDKQDIVGSAKYIDEKYLVIEINIPKLQSKFQCVIEWDKRSKKLKQWFKDSDGELTYLISSLRKPGESYAWTDDGKKNPRTVTIVSDRGKKLLFATIITFLKPNGQKVETQTHSYIEKVE